MKTCTPVLLLSFACAIGASSLLADELPPDSAVLSGCIACHTAEGKPAQAGWPHLAGMTKAEIVGKLEGHRQALIGDSMMTKIARNLTDAQIDAVAEYYSRLVRPRPQPIRVIE